jgi:excisionase family DNA binding protein
MNAARQAAVRAAVDALVAVLVDAVDRAAPTEDQPDRLLSLAETCSRLGVSRRSVYDLIGRGELRSLTVGRRRLVATTAVTAYIESRAGR